MPIIGATDARAVYSRSLSFLLLSVAAWAPSLLDLPPGAFLITWRLCSSSRSGARPLPFPRRQAGVACHSYYAWARCLRSATAGLACLALEFDALGVPPPAWACTAGAAWAWLCYRFLGQCSLLAIDFLPDFERLRALSLSLSSTWRLALVPLRLCDSCR